MAIAARVNTVAEGETPIASYKYNEEMNNVYTVLNSIASFFASATPPSSPGAGQYWLDTSVSTSVLRQFDGSVWRWTGFYFGTSAPSNPAAGAFFIDSASGTMAYWTGTAWAGLPATAISYDGTDSGLVSDNVQDAIDEVSVDYEAAATAVTQAQGYASAASASAAGAAGSAGLAGDYALAASVSATDAEESAEKAEAWSDGVGEVEPGRFSAKFWADAASEGVVPDGSISNAKLSNMESGTLKGRDSEGTGEPEDLSVATVKTMIGDATTSASGLMSAADKTKLDGLTEDVASEGYVDAAVSPWKTGPAFSRASDATFTVADNAANQAIFAKGRPIRYRETAGTWRYGMVDGYSSGTVTLVGAPMTESDDDEMEYGDPNRVAQVEFFVGGKFADAADTGLLASDAKTFFSWGLTAGFLVRIRHRVARDDSGANQPQVTVSIGGSVVGTDNTNAGLAVAESWTSTTTGINVSNYDIAMGDAMEVVTDANGSNDDAYDLTVSCTFVLE